jgi:7-cyano-7-deazaguanine synthase
MSASAVLFSGGLDSAVLLALELAEHAPVWPLHVRVGFAWEQAEARAIARLLERAPFAGRVAAPAALSVEMRDVYPGDHWAVTGQPPAYDTPDEDVYLDGRNIVLIAKAAVWCARHGVERLAIGPLLGNPFPDATPDFFTTMARAMSLGLGRPFSIAAPIADLHKEDVIQLGAARQVPLDLTLSCMNPAGDRHCGLCSKCRERQVAFRKAGTADPTDYARQWSPRA